LLAEEQYGANRDRNHDQHCKDGIPDNYDRMTRTAGAAARDWHTLWLECRTGATRHCRLRGRKAIATPFRRQIGIHLFSSTDIPLFNFSRIVSPTKH
jgi:hypothetical protein